MEKSRRLRTKGGLNEHLGRHKSATGPGFTITGKEHYGCYTRKSRGKQECANSRTITRHELESRVLARLRKGLMTPAFAQQFAEEVTRLMSGRPDQNAASHAALEAQLRKAEGAIERLLDRLEGDDASAALMERLKAREAELFCKFTQEFISAVSKHLL